MKKIKKKKIYIWKSAKLLEIAIGKSRSNSIIIKLNLELIVAEL